MRRALVLIVFGVLTAPAAGAEADELLARLKAVGAEGTGNAEAARAWGRLVRLGPEALPAVLAALDDADATAANWLRTAVDAIAERELSAARPLPADKLEAFVRDTRHAGRARRLAYELLVRADATAPGRLVPGMLHDPSPELRRDAVALALKDADALLGKDDKSAATAAYQKALSGARDRDQVDRIAKQLKQLNVAVDLAAHFGFLRTWQVLGPFDNTNFAGFARVYPPEEGIDAAAAFKGKTDSPLRWTSYTTPDPYGMVDLNKALGKHMGATGYAHAVLLSEAERPAEVRAGSNNAVKIFVNGKLAYFREEYHHGLYMDQHVARVTLKAGRNEILVKVCQNEQKDDWAQGWSFQLRVCDAVGTPVPLKTEGGK